MGDGLSAFWISLGAIFSAELGDKTQLVALCLASRFKTGVVLAGVFCATLAVHVVSVPDRVPAWQDHAVDWIHLAAGVAFHRVWVLDAAGGFVFGR